MTIETPRFRIDARADWRADGKPASRNTLITAINPGTATSAWESEKVKSVDQLKALFKSANKKNKITFLVNSVYASLIFPKGRDISFLSVEVKEWNAQKATLTPTCKDLKVVSNMASTDETKQNIVTLQMKGDFTDL